MKVLTGNRTEKDIINSGSFMNSLIISLDKALQVKRNIRTTRSTPVINSNS